MVSETWHSLTRFDFTGSPQGRRRHVEDLNTLREFRAIDPIPLWTFSHNERSLMLPRRDIGLEPASELHADVIKETSALMHIAPELLRDQIARQLSACCANLAWEVLKGNFFVSGNGLA